jgi:AcrR family transcriptional regulator
VQQEQNTRQLILDAALKEFHQNGFKGARTTRIAEAAGISRTMLHYYFNTKEALFEAVLNATFGSVLPHLFRMADQEADIFALLQQLVGVVSDVLEEHPGLPSFVVNILNESPDLILNLTLARDERTPDLLETVLVKARAQGQVRPDINGENLLIDTWALCSTAYLLAPYISAKEGRNAEQMHSFHRARRQHVLTMLTYGIRPI